MNESNKLKGGLSDKMSVSDIAKKHNTNVSTIKNQVKKGVKVEKEHTKNDKVAKEIAKDHEVEDPKYYDHLSKMEKEHEVDEMDSGASGSFEAPMNFLKKDLYAPKTKEQDIDEVTSGVDGSFDVPLFGGTKGRSNPLSIGGEKTIGARANKIEHTKSFPKFGGPDAKFVTINSKCKKFPYCNQGDPKAVKISEDKELSESIKEISKKYGIPINELEKAVINEINQIFI